MRGIPVVTPGTVTAEGRSSVDRVSQGHCRAFSPYWHSTIAPTIRAGRRVLITPLTVTACRACVKYLDDMSDEEIPSLNIPTGIPVVYGEAPANSAR